MARCTDETSDGSGKRTPAIAPSRGDDLDVLKPSGAVDEDKVASLLASGVAESNAGRLNAAVDLLELAASIDPDAATIRFELANTYMALRRTGDAADGYAAVIALQPAHARAHSRLGMTLLARGKGREALASCMRATKLAPRLAEGWVNLGRVFDALKLHDLSAGAYRKAIAAAPDQTFLVGRRLQQQMICCEWSELPDMIDRIDRASERGKLAVHPFCWQAISRSPSSQLRVAERFAHHLHPSPPARAKRPRSSRHERIRVGYVSGELRHSATTLLMAGVFEHHDHQRFEIVAIDSGWDDASASRGRIARAIPDWISIREIDDATAAALIAAREIDILVNLNGYFGEARTGVFHARPAPVQVSYLGYPGTMGADYMDYLIADKTLIQERDRQFYQEKIVYLPNSYQATDIGREIASPPPDRAACGLPEHGFVFCCFNASYKILPEVFARWIAVLHSVNGSILWLLDSNPVATANLRAAAIGGGLDADRLVFAPVLPSAEHLARHRCADLFLDTQPCTAHTTASDALWAGLPVLTCRGETFAGRVAESLLHSIGLPELVAPTLDAYRAQAVRLANNPAELAGIRLKLARNRLTTSLFDTAAYTRHLETAFTAMYARSREGLPPDHIVVPVEPPTA